ncbi:MAG TPA: class I SAM-dependent methyltransferase [Acidimicrobiales bacterium]|nr:class I SAM-dependent methyltransferase [Acidimicrobiales bacterium]
MAKQESAAQWDVYFRRAGRSVLATRSSRSRTEDYFAQGAASLLELVDFVAAPKQGRALDIGCGDGRLTRTLVSLYTSVVAQDVAPSVLDACRRNLEDANNVEFTLGNVEVLAQYPDSSFDFVVSTTVFQHISSCTTVRSYIGEASRLLAPGGVAALQLRDPSMATRLRDFAVDVARVPTRLPSFHHSWRGCRLRETEAREAAEANNRVVEWRPQRRFVWFVIRHPL